MRVLVLGDTHGDSKWCAEVTRIAGEHGVERILQVGDFGYWPRIELSDGWRSSWADWFLGEIARACATYGVAEWIVIDGNHDDHQELQTVLRQQPDDDGLLTLGERVRYSPRGNSFKLAGSHIGTLGGAASIDAYLEQTGIEFGPQPYRIGWDWFPDLERPTLRDVERLPGELDILLTHEAPLEVNLSRFNGFPGIFIPPEVQKATDAARIVVSAAMWDTKPKLLIHGHWHGRNRVQLNYHEFDCEVVGLASNSRRNGRDKRAYVVLDLPDLTVKTIGAKVTKART